MMENGRLYKIEFTHTLGTPDSERIKVAALNLFHPTAFPRCQMAVFLYCDTVSLGRGMGKFIFFWLRAAIFYLATTGLHPRVRRE